MIHRIAKDGRREANRNGDLIPNKCRDVAVRRATRSVDWISFIVRKAGVEKRGLSILDDGCRIGGRVGG